MTEPDDGSLEDYLEAFLRFADGRSCVVQLGITPLALWRRAGTARRRWQRRACELYPASLSNAVVDKARKKNPKFNTKGFRQRFLSARGGRERLQALILAQHPAVLDLAG